MTQTDWHNAINHMRQSVPEAQFRTWLKPLKLVRIDESSIVLGVPNGFHADWVKDKYAKKLNDAIRHTIGLELDLEFEVLVRDENIEAALSSPLDDAETLELKTNGEGRPALRLVSSESDTDLPEEIAGSAVPITLPTAKPALKEPLDLPVFKSPYWELHFNQVAYQCARMVGSNALPMNPLILMGGIGMGKTHLLVEIALQARLANPSLRIRYTNFERFTAEMVQGFQNNTILSFKRKYREETDLLLFDDIQGLATRARSQEELLHIFNDIVGRGGHVVFTCKTGPNPFEGFSDGLKSRLLSGVVAEINSPSFEDRVEILRRTAEHHSIFLEDQVIRSLADQGQKDVRELMGSVIRLHLQASLENKSLDQNFVSQKGWAQEARKENITMDEIISLVEHTFGVSRNDLMSKSRKSNVTWARQVAMYLGRHYTLLPLEQIGKIFGRDHATVIHAFQKVQDMTESQPQRKYEVEFLKKKISSRSSTEPSPF